MTRLMVKITQLLYYYGPIVNAGIIVNLRYDHLKMVQTRV